MKTKQSLFFIPMQIKHDKWNKVLFYGYFLNITKHEKLIFHFPSFEKYIGNDFPSNPFCEPNGALGSFGSLEKELGLDFPCLVSPDMRNLISWHMGKEGRSVTLGFIFHTHGKPRSTLNLLFSWLICPY